MDSKAFYGIDHGNIATAVTSHLAMEAETGHISGVLRGM